MTKQYIELLNLLEQKRDYFLQYELETDNIILNSNDDSDESVDQIIKSMDNRNKIANNIDIISAQIHSINIKYNINKDLFSNTTQNTSFKNNYEEEIHKQCLNIFDIMRRIQLKNIDISNYFTRTYETSKKQIEKNQYTPKISKYFDNIKINTNYSNTFGKG